MQAPQPQPPGPNRRRSPLRRHPRRPPSPSRNRRNRASPGSSPAPGPTRRHDLGPRSGSPVERHALLVTLTPASPRAQIGGATNDRSLHPVRPAELGHHLGHVALDGGLAHVEAGGGLGGGKPLSSLGRALALARGEPAQRQLSRRPPGRGRVRAEPLDERPGDGRRQHGLARRYQSYRPDDVDRRRVLQQEAARPCPQRPEHVLVQLEGRQHDDLGRFAQRGNALGRVDPVEPRHANVHQHNIGPVRGDACNRRRPVSRLANHAQIIGRRQDGPKPGPHQRVIVRQQDPKHRIRHDLSPPTGRSGSARRQPSHGNAAVSTKSPPPSGPCASVPPASATRSARLTSPSPDPGSSPTRSPASRPLTGSLLRTSTSSPSPAQPASEPAAAVVPACLLTLVSASRTIRYASLPIGPGTASGSSTVMSSPTLSPAFRYPSTKGAMSRSVGCGASGACACSPSCSTPIMSRNSVIAWRAVDLISPAVFATSSGGRSGRISSAPACNAISETRCASTSCISTAIAARSARRACPTISCWAASAWRTCSRSDATSPRRAPIYIPSATTVT